MSVNINRAGVAAVGGAGIRPNLLKNSDLHLGTTTWFFGVNGSSIRVETKEGKKTITATKGTTNILFGQQFYSYTANQIVNMNVSADVYVEEPGTIATGMWVSSTEVSGWQSAAVGISYHLPAELTPGWNKVNFWISNRSQYNGNFIWALGYVDGATLWATNIKIELGTKATPYCLSESEGFIAASFAESSSTPISFGKNWASAREFIEL